MDEDIRSCNFLYSDVIDASVPDNSLIPRLKTQIRRYREWVSSHINRLFYQSKVKNGINIDFPENEVLNLQPGEWVQVRSMDEISTTLDENRKYKGLSFMKEMEKFCGGKFRVFKKVGTIRLESTGEIRKLRSPSVFLEGVYCNGERHSGCDRACFHFWREIWLKRI